MNPRRRRSPATVAGVGIGGTVAVLAMIVLGIVGAQPGGAAEASASLFDDAQGLAVFAGTQLLPGSPAVGCIEVGVNGAGADDVVELTAERVTGDLAGELQLAVDVGTGGHAGDCSGFTGRSLWRGSLTSLADGPAVLVGWHPATSPRRSFRFTALAVTSNWRVGRRAAGDLVWRLVPDPATNVTPTSTSTTTSSTTAAVPTTSPVPATAPPPSTDAPAPTTTADAGWPLVAGLSLDRQPARVGAVAARAAGQGTPTTTGPSAVGPDRIPGAAGGPAPERPGAADVTITGRRDASVVARQVTRTVVTTVDRPGYPVSAMALALAFVVVEQAWERRDPKLMMAARSTREAEHEFIDVFPDASAAAPARWWQR